MSKSESSPLNRSIISFVIISALGYFLMTWSALDWYALMQGSRTEASFCTISAYWNCDVATMSVFGSIAGIPIGAFGALWFVGFFLVCLSSRPHYPLVLLFSISGILACVGLATALFFIIKGGCFVCLMGYVLVMGAVFLGLRIAKQKLSPFGRALRWGVAGFAILILLVGSLRGLYKMNQGYPEEEFMAYFQSIPVVDVPMVSPFVAGPENAKITVVEFSDFGCPFCARAAATLLPFLKLQKDVKVVFYPYPLDNSCNPRVKHAGHARSCDWTKAVICAKDQGKEWQVHDEIFLMASRSRELPLVSETAESFGLNAEKLSTCMKDPKTEEILQAMLRAAGDLSIESTPTFFINGKIIKGVIGMPLLKRFLEEFRKQ